MQITVEYSARFTSQMSPAFLRTVPSGTPSTPSYVYKWNSWPFAWYDLMQSCSMAERRVPIHNPWMILLSSVTSLPLVLANSQQRLVRATGQVGRIPEGSVLTIVLACSLPTSRIYRRSYCAKRTPQAPRSERSLWASSCIKPNDPSQKALAVNALSRAALRMSGVWQISKLRHVEARPSNDRHPVVTAR